MQIAMIFVIIVIILSVACMVQNFIGERLEERARKRMKEEQLAVLRRLDQFRVS